MKPYCELCQTHHEKYQAHVFKPVANSVANKARAVAGSRPAETVTGPSRLSLKPKADVGGSRHPSAGDTACRQSAASRLPESDRVQKWREKNREKYNERERERMRKLRAGKKPLGIAYG